MICLERIKSREALYYSELVAGTDLHVLMQKVGWIDLCN